MKKKMYQLTDEELCKIAESHCKLYHNCSDATRLLAEVLDRYSKARNIIEDLTREE